MTNDDETQSVDHVEKKLEEATTFPLEVRDKKYQVNFRQDGNQAIYCLMDGEDKGLETKTSINFFISHRKRGTFYKNIIDAIGETEKREIDEIKKDLAKILYKVQQSEIFVPEKKSKYVDAQEKHLQQEKEGVIKTIKLDDDTYVVHTKSGIVEERRKFKKVEGEWEEKWMRHRIYSNHIKPLEKLEIDEEFTVFKYKADREHIADIPTIIKNLKKGGGVLNRKRFDDCINAIFSDLPERTGYATYGIYIKGDKLELCLDAMPFKDMQRKIKIQCEPSLRQEITKKSLEAYFHATDFWHDYEVLPSMAMGAIGPFALMLRKKGKLVPIIWHYSIASRLGKTLVQRIFSSYLFCTHAHTGDAIDSKFRLSSVLDGICTYQIVDEAEQVNWELLAGILKEAPENYICNIRGMADQTILQYLSRAVLGCNSNRFPIRSENILVRIFKIEFDEKVVDRRAGKDYQVELLDTTTNELTPIGWRLAEIELENIEYSFDKLLERIDSHERELRRVYKAFFDPRRVTAWSIIFEGLKIWESAAIKYDLEWRAPSYEDFVDDVVDPIETTTKETGELPIMDFISWWQMWKTKNVDRIYSENGEIVKQVKGLNGIWAENRLLIHRSEYFGDVITKAIQREYKIDKNSKIDTLKEIAKMIGMKTGIPEEKLLKTWSIGGRTQRAVFLPYVLIEEDIPQKILEDKYIQKEEGIEKEKDQENNHTIKEIEKPGITKNRMSQQKN